jgi:hypothetical protein
VLSLITFVPSPALAFFGSSSGSYDTLTEMTDDIAGEMKSDLTGRHIYLNRDEIRDEQDGSSSQFAGLLASEMERALSRAGFVFEGRMPAKGRSAEEQRTAAVTGDLADLADYKVVVSYRTGTDRIQVYVKLRDNKKDMTYRSLKQNYEIAMARLPAGIFADTLDNRLLKMASKIGAGTNQQDQLTVFVTPVLESRKKYSSPFAEYVTRKFKALLSERSSIRVLEETADLQKLTAKGMVKKPTLDQVMSEEYAGADALLEGSYLRGTRQSINLAVTLKGLNGKTVALAEDDIPYSLISYSLENDAAETLSMLTDIEHESANGAVRIGTIKGSDYQVFREGEIVSFTLQVKKPLYVYVYNINSNAEVSLLYPKAGAPETAKTPGKIYTIPDSSDSWEIKVEPPFGTDAVKVFASDRRLPIPTVDSKIASRSFSGGTRSLARIEKTQGELAQQKMINGHDLVDWYKGIAAGAGVQLYESTVYVETRAK